MKTLAGLDYEEVLPKSGGEATSIVVLLHGLGSNAQDLISLSPYWADALPDTLFISPNAPFPCDMAPVGYQWFSLQSREHADMLKGVQTAQPKLDAFMDAALKEYGLSDDKMAVVGFSQGSMMTMYTMPRRSKPCAGALCYSGALIDDGAIDEKPETLTKMPIVLVHGKEDDVVPFNAFDHAGAYLQKAGFDIRGYACEGLGHSIDANGVKQGMDFLQSVLYPKS